MVSTYCQKKSGTEGLSDLLKVTQLVKGRAGFELRSSDSLLPAGSVGP